MRKLIILILIFTLGVILISNLFAWGTDSNDDRRTGRFRCLDSCNQTYQRCRENNPYSSRCEEEKRECDEACNNRYGSSY